jgi:hypothetical protein
MGALFYVESLSPEYLLNLDGLDLIGIFMP